jgi:hypothetical protein
MHGVYSKDIHLILLHIYIFTLQSRMWKQWRDDQSDG